ncbi:MAG: hypothetical protein OHK0012_00680 [Synechococcales cyanobacterium]
MNEFELMLQRSLYLLIGGASLCAKEASHLVETLGQRTEAAVDHLVREGEAVWQEWNAAAGTMAHPALKARLYELVRGDWELAERLLAQARAANPGHSEDWYYDKVIYDLHRDHL